MKLGIQTQQPLSALPFVRVLGDGGVMMDFALGFLLGGLAGIVGAVSAFFAGKRKR